MKTEFTFAENGDEALLKRTYLNCFDDTMGFVTMLFRNHFVPQNTVVLRADGKIAGEALLLPCSVDGRKYYYCYALCIEKTLRGRGLGLTMLDFIKARADREDAAFVLHPETDELSRFYEKGGLVPCSWQQTKSFQVSGHGNMLLPVTPNEYKEIRDRRFDPKTLLRWDLPSVEYALLQEQFFGGFCFKTHAGGATHVLLGNFCDGIPVVKETTAPESALSEVATAVGARFGTKTVDFKLPSAHGKCVGFGYSARSDVYMNLLLD